MSYYVLSGGFLVFILSLLIHVVIWRARAPRNDVRALLLIFLALPVFALIAAKLALEVGESRISFSGIDLVEVLLLHTALAISYIASYPAARAHSPSLAIVRIIASSSERKMTGEEIVKRFTSKDTIVARVEDLSIYNLITVRDEMLTLKPLALIIIRFYLFYRGLLGLPPGKG